MATGRVPLFIPLLTLSLHTCNDNENVRGSKPIQAYVCFISLFTV